MYNVFEIIIGEDRIIIGYDEEKKSYEDLRRDVFNILYDLNKDKNPSDKIEWDELGQHLKEMDGYCQLNGLQLAIYNDTVEALMRCVKYQ